MDKVGKKRTIRKRALFIAALSLLIVSCGPKGTENVPEEAEEVTLVNQVREDTENKANDTAQGTTDGTAQDPAAEDQKEKAEPEEKPEISLEEEEAAGQTEKEKDTVSDSAVYDAEEKTKEGSPSGSGQEAGSVSTHPEEGEIVVPSGGQK